MFRSSRLCAPRLPPHIPRAAAAASIAPLRIVLLQSAAPAPGQRAEPPNVFIGAMDDLLYVRFKRNFPTLAVTPRSHSSARLRKDRRGLEHRGPFRSRPTAVLGLSRPAPLRSS